MPIFDEILAQKDKELALKQDTINSQASQIANLSQQLKNQSSTFYIIQSKVDSLKSRIKDQMQKQARPQGQGQAHSNPVRSTG